KEGASLGQEGLRGVLEAAQGDRRTNGMQAPKVICFDRQRVNLRLAAGGANVTLGVTPAVSADRRLVPPSPMLRRERAQGERVAGKGVRAGPRGGGLRAPAGLGGEAPDARGVRPAGPEQDPGRQPPVQECRLRPRDRASVPPSDPASWWKRTSRALSSDGGVGRVVGEDGTPSPSSAHTLLPPPTAPPRPGRQSRTISHWYSVAWPLPPAVSLPRMVTVLPTARSAAALSFSDTLSFSPQKMTKSSFLSPFSFTGTWKSMRTIIPLSSARLWMTPLICSAP